MPTRKHFQSIFYTNFSNTFNVEIWHKTTTVPTTTEIKLGKNGFDINWNKLNDAILGGVMASKCKISFLVTNGNELSDAHRILNAQNGTYYVKIYKNITKLFWSGWITSGFDGYPDAPFPYIVDLKASDSLNKPLNKYNNQVDVSGQSDYKDLLEPLSIFETTYSIDDITDSKRFAFQTDWYNAATGTPPANTNPLRKTYYNRAAFVTDPDNFPLTIENFNAEFAGILKPFMLRVLFSAGKYWLQQPAFLDKLQPDPILATNAGDAATDISYGQSGNTTHIANVVEIDNTASPTTIDKGIILAGAKYSLKPEAKSVRATYIFGNNFCTMPTSTDYTAGAVQLGYISQGTANISLFLNHKIKQTFPLTGPNAVTPCFGQADSMTGVMSFKLKVGNKYLKQTTGNPLNFEWTTVDSSCTVFTGAGTSYANGPGGVTTAQQNVEEALNMVGGYGHFTTWQNDIPTTNTATATATFYLAGVPLPDLGSSYGVVSFEILPNAFIYYWTQYIPFVNVWNNWNTWLNDHNPAASTNLNYDFGTNTPVVPATQTNLNGIVPYSSDITIEEELNPDADAEPMGAVYFASQTGNDQAPDVDLGGLTLGGSGTGNQITTLRARVGTDYVSPGGFRVGTTGLYSSPGQLLVNEYFKTKDEPLISVSGTIISTSYEAHKAIRYEEKIGGSKANYIFGGGKFNPLGESWAGTWIKLNISTATITETEEEIYTDSGVYDPGSGPGGGYVGNGEMEEIVHGPKTPTKGGLMPVADHTQYLSTKQRYLLNDSIVGITTEAAAFGVNIDKLNVLSLKCKVYDNQKLFISDSTMQGVTELITNTEQLSGALQIKFNALVFGKDYPAGSYIMLRTNDITNHITAGTATPDLYLGVTTTRIHIKPDQFKTWSSSSIQSYSRDILGSVQPSAYASRTKVYASTFIPLGYKVTQFNIYSSANRSMQALTSRTSNDTITSRGYGTSNTPQLITAWPSVDGEYFILTYEIGASTDEIYGALIEMQAI